MAIPRNLANFAPKLDSSGNPTFTAPTVFSAGTASLPSITFTGDTNTGIFSPGADTIAFAEGGTESMRIDSSGNLGLGSTSPSTYDDANGGRNFVLQATGAGRGVITFASQQTGGANELLGRINFIDSDSTNTNYRGAQIDGLLGSDANSAYLRFNTANSGAGTERMRITQAGTVLIGTTSTTANGGVLQISNGITFPATQSASSNANTLDDYEEGDWTPVISGSSTAGTYELGSTTYAQYTKIGRQVTLTCIITLAGSVTGGGSGYLKITGLPFSKSVNQSPVGSVSFSSVDFTGDFCTIEFTTVLSSVAELYISETRDNNTPLDLPISAISASDRIAFTITYFV